MQKGERRRLIKFREKIKSPLEDSPRWLKEESLIRRLRTPCTPLYVPRFQTDPTDPTFSRAQPSGRNSRPAILRVIILRLRGEISREVLQRERGFVSFSLYAIVDRDIEPSAQIEDDAKRTRAHIALGETFECGKTPGWRRSTRMYVHMCVPSKPRYTSPRDASQIVSAESFPLQVPPFARPPDRGESARRGRGAGKGEEGGEMRKSMNLFDASDHAAGRDTCAVLKLHSHRGRERERERIWIARNGLATYVQTHAD